MARKSSSNAARKSTPAPVSPTEQFEAAFQKLLRSIKNYFDLKGTADDVVQRADLARILWDKTKEVKSGGVTKKQPSRDL